MSDATQVPESAEIDDVHAADELLPLVYDELRRLAAHRIAAESGEQTLTATALVHEAYLRLVDVDRAQKWKSRGHFFSAAAEAMRRILIEAARRKRSVKRGGGSRRATDVPLDVATSDCDPDLLLDIDDGLARLSEEDAEAAQLVKLRLFAGLSVSEAGELLGMSRSAAYRNWDFVRSWFAVRLPSGH